MSDHWLPPDQLATQKFPVIGERAPGADAPDFKDWKLVINGCVTHPVTLNWDDIIALPQDTFKMDVHCVTRWSRQGMVFGGSPLSYLLDRVRVKGGAKFVRFVAHSDRDHDTSLPIEVVREDAWLVHRIGGEPLPIEHGGPLRVITRGRYFYKSLKWVRHIEVLAEDRLGYWERTDGYHNGADPWPGDQRYIGGSLSDAELRRFKEAHEFTRWRRRTLRGLDLRNWAPQSTKLGALKLKGCDLRGARLAGVDLRDANLSLSDLRGANLRGADLRGADLEGVFLAGANLNEADVRGSYLTAAEFFDSSAEAQVTGLLLAGAHGILEDQLTWFKTKAVIGLT